MQFKFNEVSEPIYTSDQYYDLVEGSVEPSKLLSDSEQIAEVEKAINTIKQFLRQAEEAEVIELG